MPVSQLKIESLRLVGGLAVLDYLNTCNGRRPGSSLDEVVDKLTSLEDVVRWFYRAQLIDQAEFQDCLALAKRATGGSALSRLLAMREQLYHLLLPIALGRPIDTGALDYLNRVLAYTAARQQLVAHGAEIVWAWRSADSVQGMTDNFISRLAVQAAALLTGPDRFRLKVCGTQDCDWLFIDTSKNGGRRWCQMNICGSREKARKRTLG